MVQSFELAQWTIYSAFLKMYFQLKFQPYEKFVQRCIQLRTVLNNIQEPISSCLTSSSPFKTTSNPSGPPWTVWVARMGGDRSLSRRLITTARKWLSSWSTLKISTSTGFVPSSHVFNFVMMPIPKFSTFLGRCFSNWSRWRICTTTTSLDGLGPVSRRVSDIYFALPELEIHIY